MDDRAAPPIRRDGDAADRNVVYSERAGIDYNGMIGAADAHDLKRKARDDRFLEGNGESEPSDDTISIWLDRDGSGGRRSGAEFRLALHQGFVTLQERHRILPRAADRSEAKRSGRPLFFFFAGGEREHCRDGCHGIGEVAIARQQMRQRVCQSWR